MKDSDLPHQFKELQRFVCMAYSSNGPTVLPSPRGKCSDREILRENCSHLLVQHFSLIYRERIMYACGTNPMCHPVQSYPNLRKTVGTLIPRIMVMNLLRCVAPPALKAVLELVKCGCQKKCSKNCSCVKNKLPCTALCKCYAWGCNSCSGIHKRSRRKW